MRVIAHDYETTGVNAKTCGVVQSAIAIVDINDDGTYTIIAQEVALHNPGCPIPAGASNVHGIYDKDVTSEGPYEENLLATYEQAMSEFDPEGLLGFNSNRFDNVISRRIGLTAPLIEIDLFTAASRLANEGYLKRARLVDAYEGLTGREPQNAHDAFADIVMTLDLIQPAMSLTGHGNLEAFITWLNNPVANPKMKMPFGKHKGLPLNTIPQDYLQWLIKKSDLQTELAMSVKAALGGAA